MIYKFSIPPGKFRPISESHDAAGCLAVVRAPSKPEALAVLAAYCEANGLLRWGEAADVREFEEQGAPAVLGYAEV